MGAERQSYGQPCSSQSHDFAPLACCYPWAASIMYKNVTLNFGFQCLFGGHFLQENLKASTEVSCVTKQYPPQKGSWVPGHMITHLLMSVLEIRSSQHWLLDGFPRTLIQVEALDRIWDLDTVISLSIPFETLKRLSQLDPPF